MIDLVNHFQKNEPVQELFMRQYVIVNKERLLNWNGVHVNIAQLEFILLNGIHSTLLHEKFTYTVELSRAIQEIRKDIKHKWTTARYRWKESVYTDILVLFHVSSHEDKNIIREALQEKVEFYEEHFPNKSWLWCIDKATRDFYTIWNVGFDAGVRFNALLCT